MSQLEVLAAQVALNQSGAYGTKVVLPLDDDLYFVNASMKATAYTVAAQPKCPCRVTAYVTASGTADTLGNLYVTGTLPDGSTCREAVALTAATTASTVNEFATLTQLITPEWVIDAGSGNDTIKIGTGATIAGGATYEADVDKIVTSTNMIVGPYAIAAQPNYPAKITITATAGATADTMGTIRLIGLGVGGMRYEETLTPVAGSTVTSTYVYDTLEAVIGAGWVIDEAEGTNDTITVGVAAVTVASQYYISALHVLVDTVVAAQTAITGKTTADLTQYTKLTAGVYPCKLSAVSLTSGEAIAYLAPIQSLS